MFGGFLSQVSRQVNHLIILIKGQRHVHVYWDLGEITMCNGYVMWMEQLINHSPGAGPH